MTNRPSARLSEFERKRQTAAIQEIPNSIRSNNLRLLRKFLPQLPSKGSHSLSSFSWSLFSKSETLPVPPSQFPTTSLHLLHLCAFYDSLECFLFLHSRGYSCSILTPCEYQPIHFAALGNAIEVASYLVREAGVFLDLQPPNGYSALYLAVASHSSTIVRLLLSLSRQKPPDDFGAIISRALQEGDGETLELLLSSDTNTGSRSDGLSPLMIAAALGFAEAVELLLHRGCDPNHLGVGNNSALRAACLGGSAETVAALLRGGADPNIVGNGGQTAIHWAAMSGNLEIVNLVLQVGALVETVCEAGLPAWVYGMGTKDQKKVIQMLLKAGVPVNGDFGKGEGDDVRRIPGLRAVCVDDPELMGMLLEFGLDLNVVVRGVTLREMALEIAAPRVREVIENWGRKEGG